MKRKQRESLSSLEVIPERQKSKELKRIDSKIITDKIFEMLDEEQTKAFHIIEANYITLLTGIWGTGKSFVAVARAINDLESGKKRKIILTNPGSDVHDLGFRPGTVEDKMESLIKPMKNAMYKLVGKGKIDSHFKTGAIEVLPFQDMRGWNFEDTIAIADEVQNMTFNDFKTLTSRLCKGSKLILCGDIAQTDIPKCTSGLSRFCKFVDKEFAIVELLNNHRAPIVERLSKFFAEEEKVK